MMMRGVQRTSWVAVALCCIAAVLQPPLCPQWVTVALIVPALVLMTVGLAIVQREWREVNEALDLQDLWRRQRDRAR